MSANAGEAASGPVHEFQVLYRVRPSDGSGGWSQVQSAWSNAADAHAFVGDTVEQQRLDPDELVGAAAERVAAAEAADQTARAQLEAGDAPGAGTAAPGGM